MAEPQAEPNGAELVEAAEDGGAPPPAGRDPGAELGEPPRSWRIRPDAQLIDDPLLHCLVVLSRLLERPISADALRAGLPLENDRLTPELVPRAAARAGLSARLLRRPLDEISPLALPCILLLEQRRACVLIAREGDDAVVVLPESGQGQRRIALAELRELYNGYAFFALAEVDPGEREGPRPAAEGHWFWSTLLRQWPVYSEVAVAALLINIFALASPLFVMNVYDRVVPNNALDTLWVLAIGAFIVYGFDFLLKTLRGYFVDSAGRAADIVMASRLFEQVMGIKMAARPASAGGFASNLREFETLRDFFTSATLTAVVDLPFVLLFIVIIWVIGGPVALVPTLAVPLVIGVGLALQVPLNRIVRRTFRETTQKHGLLVEAINGLETIKSVGAEGRMQRAWERLVALTAHSGNQARLLSALTVNFAALAANLVYIAIVIVGVYEIAAGNMTMGALIACTIIGGRAMAPLGQVAALLTRFNQAKTSLEALNGIMAMPVERPAQARFVNRPSLRGEIEFREVTFTYPQQKLAALSRVSFKIAAGERIGLIGRIGSGKSTVEKLILGLYEPQQGSILIDGTDIRQIDPADLRRNIGCVPQDVFLFQASLRENITLGAGYADDEMVLRAARVAGVDDFAARHPMGYDLPVGERGENLSGGQRQAIAVARALLLDPPILVLDEPTSAMDNAAENRLKARLMREVGGRTLLLVTHRSSMLALVDRLIVMDAGRVVADGPKERVLKALQQGQVRG